MKVALRRLVPSILGLAAFAPVSLASGGAPAPVVAELDVTGGLMPYDARLGIQVDGHVVLISKRLNDPEVTQELARLSPDAMTALNAKIAVLTSVPLKDQQEGEPSCLDAGTETIVAYVGGQRVQLQQLAGCHEFKRPDHAGGAIIDLLNGFYRLVD